jgi:hypothetical protein
VHRTDVTLEVSWGRVESLREPLAYLRGRRARVRDDENVPYVHAVLLQQPLDPIQ